MTVYNINFGSGKLEPIETESKNRLPVGTVLKMHGYNEPEYVVVGIRDIDTKYGNGTIYLTVNLDTFAQRRHESVTLHWESEKKLGIHTAITDRILPEEEVRAIWNKSEAVRLHSEDNQRKAKEERECLEEIGKALFEKYIPADAKGLIVAEHNVNQSDIMTDYHGHTTTETVILAWSSHTKDLFSEMRKAALAIPETQHLGPGRGHFSPIVVQMDDIPGPPYYYKGGGSHWHDELMKDGHGEQFVFSTRLEAEGFIKEKGEPHSISFDGVLVGFAWEIREEEIEHRQKYSMGAGYFLKDGFDDSDGWGIHKIRKYGDKWSGIEGLYVSLAKRCIFAPIPSIPLECTGQSISVDGGSTGGAEGLVETRLEPVKQEEPKTKDFFTVERLNRDTDTMETITFRRGK